MMLAIMSIVTTVYGIGASFAGLFQVRTIRTRKSSCDVSMHFLATYVGGDALWLFYGILVNSAALIITDVAGIVCGGITIAYAVIYHGSCQQQQQERDAS